MPLTREAAVIVFSWPSTWPRVCAFDAVTCRPESLSCLLARVGRRATDPGLAASSRRRSGDRTRHRLELETGETVNEGAKGATMACEDSRDTSFYFDPVAFLMPLVPLIRLARTTDHALCRSPQKCCCPW
jgi:hypothetical protein